MPEPAVLRLATSAGQMVVTCGRLVVYLDRVDAVLGGFHLTGPGFEPIIPATVAAMKDLAPSLVVPGHCTGESQTS